MQASLIIIGNEILSGETLDTNSNYMAKAFNKVQLKLRQIKTISDDKEAIKNSLKESLEQDEVVITTGGLGPTKDDITKTAIAEVFGCKIKRNDAVLDYLKQYFEGRKMTLSKLNAQQADLPELAKPLQNDKGTAPGMLIEKGGKMLFSVPGVPMEMKYLLDERILPHINQKLDMKRVHHKNIRTIGIRESVLAEKIESIEDNLPAGLSLAYLPSLGMVKLRLSSYELDKPEFDKHTKNVIEALEEKIGKYIYGYDDENISRFIGKLLKEQNTTVSTAESCTGGYLAHLITSIPGSSDYFEGSTLSYSNEIKMKELQVKESDLREKGAVSREVVEQMVKGAIERYKTDYAISTSGIAGPDGGSEDKPVGTVWIAAGNKEKVISKRYQFMNDRMKNIHLSGIMGLDMLRRLILNIE